MFFKSFLLLGLLIHFQLSLQLYAINLPLEEEKFNSEKRPFCNSFSGCGKKRSTIQQLPYQPFKLMESNAYETELPDDNILRMEGLADLFDVNAEPAVENVRNQILSQAKIYEAIKEASQEIYRQKILQQLEKLQHQIESDKVKP